MSLASEVTTWQEDDACGDGPVTRYRSRVRTNVGPEQFKARLETLGLLAFAEHIERYETNWHWIGTGQGYAIIWKSEATFADLLPLARL